MWGGEKKNGRIRRGPSSGVARYAIKAEGKYLPCHDFEEKNHRHNVRITQQKILHYRFEGLRRREVDIEGKAVGSSGSK